MKLNQNTKNDGDCTFCWYPKSAKASQNDTFEALGGQVGQEHVIEAPLDGEGKACSAPSEPKRVPKEDQF